MPPRKASQLSRLSIPPLVSEEAQSQIEKERHREELFQVSEQSIESHPRQSIVARQTIPLQLR